MLIDDTIRKLNVLIGEVADLRHTAALLEWDERVNMPPGGAPAHGDMLAAVRRLEHEKFTSDEIGRLLQDAAANLDGLDPDSETVRTIGVTARDYDKAVRVPADFVARQARVESAAHHAWREARANSDFSAFQPHLEKVIDLKRQYITFFPPSDHPYDVLLDDCEPGIKTADVKAMFSALRPRQVELVHALQQRPQVEDGLLHHAYPEQSMWDFAVDVISTVGFDWTRGRQDKSAHPFATAFTRDDVRITTRFEDHQPFGLLFGSLHETGHGLYEQGLDPKWNRTMLEGGASLGVHESQSRLWENLVGRSLPFWEFFFPRLQRRFPSQLGASTVEQFYRAINKVQPSLIRTEADEATYNLHVMLRVEMEMAMISDDVGVADLPALWNSRMKEYLGLVPGNAASGILQDIHWSICLFGYFATYTIGNVISVQLWEAFQSADPTRDDQIRRGDFAALRSWLQQAIHQHGRRYEPQELVERVTGAPIDPAPYLRYLETKYQHIYNL